MIEIDLLPQELRKKKKKKSKIPLRFIVFSPIRVINIFILLHIVLALAISLEKNQLHTLNKIWPSLKPQKRVADRFKEEIRYFENYASTIEQLTKKNISWVQKMNAISDYLPKGTWLTYIVSSSSGFVLKGSVFSLKSEEITLINKFLNDLKSDPAFIKDFKNLELGPVQRKTVGGFEVVDFILSGYLREESI